MGNHQITHKRLSGGNTIQHITHVKVAGNIYTRQNIVSYIDAKETFYVTSRDGKNSSQVIKVNINGVDYIKTKPDETIEDNLLTLPDC